MNLINTPKFVIFIFAAFILLAIASVAAFDFKQGIDFDNARVVQVSFDHDVNASEQNNLVNEFRQPERSDNSGSKLYRFYYQNLSSDDLSSLQSRIEEKFAPVLSFDTFTHTPGNLYPIVQGRIQNSAWLYVTGAILFAVLMLRKHAFRLIDVIVFVLAQGLSLLWAGAVLVSLTVALNYAGVAVNFWYVQAIMAAVAVILALAAFSLIRFLQKPHEEKPDNMSQQWQTQSDKTRRLALQSLLFLVILFAVFVILPFPQLLLVLVVFAGAVAGFYAQYFILPVLLKALTGLSRKYKLHKRISSRW